MSRNFVRVNEYVIKYLQEEKNLPTLLALLKHEQLLSWSFRMLAGTRVCILVNLLYMEEGKNSNLFMLLINQVVILLGSIPPIATFGILF